MKVKIRKAKPEDALKIRNAHVASIRGICSKDYTAKQIRVWSNRKPESYRKALAAGESMFVAQVGDRVVGFSVTHEGEIRAVYVHPQYVGRGIGKKLLSAVESSAKRRGFKTATISSSLTAHCFYLSQGYKTVKRAEFRFRDGTSIPCIRMKKSLKI